MQDNWGTGNDINLETNNITEQTEYQKQFENWLREQEYKNTTTDLTGENLQVLENLILPDSPDQIINGSIAERNDLLIENSWPYRDRLDMFTDNRSLFNRAIRNRVSLENTAWATKRANEKLVKDESRKNRVELGKTCTPSFLETFA